MKHKLLFPKMLWAFLMVLSSVWGWGQNLLYTTGFESGFATSQSYQSTVTTGPSGGTWKTYYGTPSTTGAISGFVSQQIRIYNDGNIGYTQTEFGTANISKVTFKAKNSAANTNVKVEYSLNGGSAWLGATLFTLSTTVADYEYFTNLSGNNAGVRIRFTLVGSAPNTGNKQIYIDDISFYDAISSNPNLSISGTASNGSTCPNTAATPVIYTITNTGTLDATGINVSSSDPQFSVSGLSTTTITAGSSATFNVTFTPTSGGSKSSVITVTSTTLGSNSPTLAVSGVGSQNVPATVTTNAASAVTSGTATFNGNVSALGSCPSSVEKGFVYGTAAGVYGNPVVVGSSVSTGNYIYDVSSLSAGTVYYYKAYVKDANGVSAFGSERTFTTLNNPVLAISGTASNGSACPNTSAAPITYTITNNGTVDATGVTVSSGNNQFALSALSSVTIAPGATSTFTTTFTPTSSGNKTATLTVTSTTAGSNTATYSISGIGSASTSGAVQSGIATNIDYISAGLNGSITSLGTCPATVEKGFIYSTTSGAGSTYPTSNIMPVGNAAVTTGAYSYNLGSLLNGTTYYYRAYIKDANNNYIYSSTERSFTTLSPATQIVFDNIPATGFVNINLSAFSVKAVAANGTTVDTGYSGGVTLAKVSGAGTLSGTATVNFVNGIANFSDIKFDTADTYVISATAGSFQTVNSNNIIISPVYAGVGRFEKISSLNDLTDGYYVIADENNAVRAINTVSSGILATAALGASNNEIINPSINSVWNLVSNSGSYSIQNSLDNKYLNYTASSTNLSTETNLTSNQQRWNITYQSGIFSVKNLLDQDRMLKYNSGLSPTGFKAYGPSSQLPEVSLYKKIETTSWNGSSWSNGLPTGKDVVITGNYSTTTQPAFTAKNISIKNSGVLEITSGNTITANNVTVEDGGNLIQRDGGVLTLPITGAFNVQKNTASVPLKYVFWSSPVAAQNIFDIYPSGNQPQYVMTYNTATNFYTQIPNAASNFTANAGVGYSVKMPANSLTGVNYGGSAKTPNNGNITVPLSNAGNGFNLIGNPYPSNINLVDFLAANQANIASTLWFWDNSGGSVSTQTGATATNNSYATFNAAGTGTWVAAPNSTSANTTAQLNANGAVAKIGQGFIVKALTASTALFNNTMRTATVGNFMNKNVNAEGKFWLKMTTSYGANLTQAVTYGQGATDALDNFDSKAMSTGADAFFSTVGTDKVIIQGRAPFAATDIVPLGTKHFESGNFTIALEAKTGLFATGQAIYLHDKQLNTYTNLQNQSYTFSSAEGEFTSRFEIVYTAGLLATSEAAKSDFEIYREGDHFVIRNSKKIESVEVYDAAGRKIITLVPNALSAEIRLDTKGMYIVKAVSAGKEFTKKISK
ncbi:hypothetical protein ASG01_12705 [Chryseobacterium sp. Leaf180]|uniref:Ig-like domain-containing protein n=1 Tax=Chryseobacterium sp. Leaf180 TaxID=1736289 RepID=UPI0006F53AE4|nr:T9SS type A sorting domain-containing protein [Chryseobacterium sp. Leaf180]KQR91859.1 hypothetical protein ASG01_12705 [Chryseobacterium sp. Leaf180]